jgi:hypothetical protein
VVIAQIQPNWKDKCLITEWTVTTDLDKWTTHPHPVASLSRLLLLLLLDRQKTVPHPVLSLSGLSQPI